jgi:hypothetical protein
MAAEPEIRAYRPGDEAGILSCYNRIFPTADGRIPPRTAAHWEWKFLRNPTGIVHHAVAVDAGAGIVGGYAGIPVWVWNEGRVELAAQAVDLMVLPEWRRAGKRPGLFVQIGLKFYELFCGEGEGKAVFNFGWPIPAWRMGQRYLRYENIRDWDITFRELAAGARRSPSSLQTKAVTRFAPDVDALFERVRPELKLALVRDTSYLNWRYAQAPLTYKLFECRQADGLLRGLCVYAVRDLFRPHTSFLVDWLASAADDEATRSMLAACETQAVADGTGVLAMVWSHADPRFLAVQRLGYDVRGTSYFLVMALFKYDTFYCRDRWYMTMGDSDLV